MVYIFTLTDAPFVTPGNVFTYPHEHRHPIPLPLPAVYPFRMSQQEATDKNRGLHHVTSQSFDAWIIRKNEKNEIDVTDLTCHVGLYLICNAYLIMEFPLDNYCREMEIIKMWKMVLSALGICCKRWEGFLHYGFFIITQIKSARGASVSWT